MASANFFIRASPPPTPHLNEPTATSPAGCCALVSPAQATFLVRLLATGGGEETDVAGQLFDLGARLRGRATVATHAPWDARAAGRADPRAFVVEIVKARVS